MAMKRFMAIHTYHSPNNERSVAISHHHVTALMDLKIFIPNCWLDEAWFVELKWSFRRIF